MRYYQFPFDGPPAADIFAQFADDPYALFFDSCDPGHDLSRCSYICVQPVEIIESFDHTVVVTNSEQQMTMSGNPFSVLKDRMEVWAPDQSNDNQINGMHRFRSGAAGYFGYDLGRSIERLPEHARRLDNIPDMAVGIYTFVMAFHHQADKNILYILSDTEEGARNRARYIFERIKSPVGNARGNVSHSIDIRPVTPKEEYKANIQKVIDYIHAGDIFQANLSLRFEGKLPASFDAYNHYLRLRELNKGPYAAFMNFNRLKVASVSPESFLSCYNGDVVTRPIKGTCPRVDEPGENIKAIEALKADEKCRAENAMIVDLLRNDLSRVCTDYSIEVPELCEVESYARVNHMVSTVKGKLRPDKHAIDLLQASFPGGSITGAPKIRAMEIIEELEPLRRGPYCGSIGFIDFQGNMETNIAIRTLVYTGESVYMNVGGGIVADSDPESEYDEVMAKASGLLASFGSGTEGHEREEAKRA